MTKLFGSNALVSIDPSGLCALCQARALEPDNELKQLPPQSPGNYYLNIFGTGETPGFTDVSSSKKWAEGRPLTSSFPDGSAGQIFIRSSPINGENTIAEIKRLSRPGTVITLMQASKGFQGDLLIKAFEGYKIKVEYAKTELSDTGRFTGDPEFVKMMRIIIVAGPPDTRKTPSASKKESPVRDAKPVSRTKKGAGS